MGISLQISLFASVDDLGNVWSTGKRGSLRSVVDHVRSRFQLVLQPNARSDRNENSSVPENVCQIKNVADVESLDTIMSFDIRFAIVDGNLVDANLF